MVRILTEEQRLAACERAHRWRTANTEKHRAYSRAYSKAHPEAQRANNHLWKKRHPEQQRKSVALWRQRHPDHIKAYIAKHQQDERVKLLRVANENKRRARKTGGGGAHTADEWIAVRDTYGCCVNCGRMDIPLTEDHIIPLAVGGTDSIDNIQPLCRPCNEHKHTSTVDYRPLWAVHL